MVIGNSPEKKIHLAYGDGGIAIIDAVHRQKTVDVKRLHGNQEPAVQLEPIKIRS
jgi:hypothetical protein